METAATRTQQIVSRWDSSEVLFECEIQADVESGMAMRYALEKATAARADLTDANLSRADLSRADLTGAYLSGADLSRANLSYANLSYANLSGAYLSGAYLSGADLSGANLSYADLSGANLSYANLSGAYLSYADLSGANLSYANLSGAYLSGAYLSGAKWRDGITISRAPLQISGLHWWMVYILDAHMQIGCELHSLDDWRSFDDARIVKMDGRNALRFWRAHKDALLAIAASDGRGVIDAVVAAA